MLLICTLLLISGCEKRPDHTVSKPPSSTPTADSKISQSTPKITGTSAPDGTTSDTNFDEPHDDYPYDIAKDMKDFNPSKIDIVVGDKLYMTQINDWYTNFSEYDGKSVEIEGYYMVFSNYTFVGRKGPTCPYCTGGYVNFEFKTDKRQSALKSFATFITPLIFSEISLYTLNITFTPQ